MSAPNALLLYLDVEAFLSMFFFCNAMWNRNSTPPKLGQLVHMYVKGKGSTWHMMSSRFNPLPSSFRCQHLIVRISSAGPFQRAM